MGVPYSSSTAIFPYTFCLLFTSLLMTFDLSLSGGFRSYWFLFLVNLACLVQSVSSKTLVFFCEFDAQITVLSVEIYNSMLEE